jgi:hypothetical protein
MGKRFIVWLSLAALLAVPSFADGPICDCGLGKMGFFDFDVRVARPRDPDAMQRYWGLFDIARFTMARVRQDRSCSKLQYIDTHVSENGTLQRTGIETANPAPPGPLSFDYVFTGEITETAGTYTAVARIEAGRTREVVKSVSYTFRDPGTGSLLPGYSVADNLASQLGPLSALITEWEKKKRDGDPGIARSNPEGTMTLRPAKTHLQPGETADVEVQLSDCDGVRLKQRKIHFDPGTYETLGRLEGTANGAVRPTEVMTDEEGRAHVKYTASQHRGPAEIHAWYGHHRPSGFPNAIVGQTEVIVGAETLGFRGVLDVEMRNDQLKHWEKHRVEIIFRSNCSTAMPAGTRCRLESSSVNASATSESHSATLTSGNAVAEIVRRAQGATLIFGWVFAGTSADEDDEHYIGLCADENWQPDHLDLTEEEFERFATLKKTVSIRANGERCGCAGSGVILLTGQDLAKIP